MINQMINQSFARDKLFTPGFFQPADHGEPCNRDPSIGSDVSRNSHSSEFPKTKTVSQNTQFTMSSSTSTTTPVRRIFDTAPQLINQLIKRPPQQQRKTLKPPPYTAASADKPSENADKFPSLATAHTTAAASADPTLPVTTPTTAATSAVVTPAIASPITAAASPTTAIPLTPRAQISRTAEVPTPGAPRREQAARPPPPAYDSAQTTTELAPPLACSCSNQNMLLQLATGLLASATLLSARPASAQDSVTFGVTVDMVNAAHMALSCLQTAALEQPHMRAMHEAAAVLTDSLVNPVTEPLQQPVQQPVQEPMRRPVSYIAALTGSSPQDPPVQTPIATTEVVQAAAATAGPRVHTIVPATCFKCRHGADCTLAHPNEHGVVCKFVHPGQACQHGTFINEEGLCEHGREKEKRESGAMPRAKTCTPCENGADCKTNDCDRVHPNQGCVHGQRVAEGAKCREEACPPAKCCHRCNYGHACLKRDICKFVHPGQACLHGAKVADEKATPCPFLAKMKH